MKFHFCQNDRYEIDTRIEFQMHMRIKHNIQRVCGYIHCVSGKLCSHENLMHRNKELRNTEHQNTGRTPTEQQNSGRTIGIPRDSWTCEEQWNNVTTKQYQEILPIQTDNILNR